ncbi:Tol-Pal system beta propeller repeat protein TolB [Aurantivibrio plasticivorans]
MRHLVAINCVVAFLVVVFSSPLYAQLEIVIDSGVDDPTPIAVSPMGWSGEPLPEDISEIVAADLRRSGLFAPVSRSDMLSSPKRESEVYYRDWRLLKTEFLVIGNLTRNPAGNYRLEFKMFDIFAERRVLSLNIEAGPNSLRDIAHHVSDKVYEYVTNIRGIFSTQIAYVEQTDKTYRLMVADADGARAKMIFQSRPDEPLLSPSWSPDGRYLAYVSYETTRPAIFIQEVATGVRQQMTNFKGLNGAPSWSPDGQKLAITLSKDGDPDIYILDIASKKLSRPAPHWAIDTEPAWTVDGKGIVFTSDRGGKPQIYQVTLASGRVERLTFSGDYNARPRVSPDGKTIVFVHRDNGVFYIAAQDTTTGIYRLLTPASDDLDYDESPTVAPNGALLLYATKYRGKGILAAVSLDSGSKFRLPSKKGDVREPAWAPFVN